MRCNFWPFRMFPHDSHIQSGHDHVPLELEGCVECTHPPTHSCYLGYIHVTSMLDLCSALQSTLVYLCMVMLLWIWSVSRAPRVIPLQVEATSIGAAGSPKA